MPPEIQKPTIRQKMPAARYLGFMASLPRNHAAAFDPDAAAEAGDVVLPPDVRTPVGARGGSGAVGIVVGPVQEDGGGVAAGRGQRAAVGRHGREPAPICGDSAGEWGGRRQGRACEGGQQGSACRWGRGGNFSGLREGRNERGVNGRGGQRERG